MLTIMIVGDNDAEKEVQWLCWLSRKRSVIAKLQCLIVEFPKLGMPK